jgi:carboxypeptidase family protein
MTRAFPASALASILLAIAVSAQTITPPTASTQRPPGQQPTRDSPAQQQQTPPPGGRITGRVVASDNGRPVKRARVFISAAELPGGRGLLTDVQGVFDFPELPAGRYTLTVAKSGFVSLSYGQRRPLQAGTPLQLVDGQQLKGIQFQLPRGSVIGGRVLDEDGEAMPGVTIRVMRYQYLQGSRRLTPAGGGQTDDKGQYRVWGLMPGDYYVNAVARGGGPFGPGMVGAFAPGGGGDGMPVFPGRGGFGGGGGRGGRGGAPVGNDQEQINYAPTYYPGVPSVNEAKPIAVGLSQEVLDINFNMQLVRVARINGHVLNPDATPVTSGNVVLTVDVAAGRGNQIGMNYGGRIQWDGEFTINNVPPGRYMLRARGDDSETPQFATLPVSVNGEDINDVSVILSAGGTITGTVTLAGTAGATPDMSQFRIVAPATDQSDVTGPQPNARVNKDGTFALEGVPAGAHLVRAAGNARGFILKSVTANGRDITDLPLQLRSGESVSNLSLVFTDQQNEINGTVTNEQGTPAPEYTILVFSTDSSFWRPLSRQIMTGRPDQTGKYRIRGLPRGEYYVVAVDPAEQGEWFDPVYLEEHRAGAARVTLSDGDAKTQDIKVKS